MSDSGGDLYDLEEFIPDFLEEAFEHIEALEENILELEKNPEDPEIIKEIFRSAHTLKGSSGSLNFSKISTLTHSIENLFDLIRNEKLKVDTEVVNIILSSIDLLQKLVTNIEKSHSEPDNIDVSGLIKKIKTLTNIDTPEDETLHTATPQEELLDESSVELDEVQLEALRSLNIQIQEEHQSVSNENVESQATQTNDIEYLNDDDLTEEKKIIFKKFVFFRIMDELFCIDILSVREVIDIIPITPINYVEKYILGIMNLRGDIIPAIDLFERLIFGLDIDIDYSKKKKNNIIICGEDNNKIGFVIDEVYSIIDIDPENIQNVKTLSSNIVKDLSLLKGIIEYNNKIVLYLDIDNITQREKIDI